MEEKLAIPVARIVSAMVIELATTVAFARATRTAHGIVIVQSTSVITDFIMTAEDAEQLMIAMVIDIATHQTSAQANQTADHLSSLLVPYS